MGVKLSYLQRARQFRRNAAPKLRSEYVAQQYNDLCTLAESFDKVVEFIKLNTIGLDLFPMFSGSKEGEFIKEMLRINPFNGDSIEHPELEFIAQKINETQCEENKAIITRWLQLDSRKRAALLEQARCLVSEWRMDELHSTEYPNTND